MKKTINFIVLLISTFFIASCGTTKTVVDNRTVDEKINMQRYVFKANCAIPTSAGFQPRHLTSEYDLKVTPDTISVYLPYFGRAYNAPYNATDGGIKFISTKFDYKMKESKKAGNWTVNIKINDQMNVIELTFDVWDNGKGTLRVFDQSKQPITFQGELE